MFLRLRRMSIKCFNCGEDHHIRDCPEVGRKPVSFTHCHGNIIVHYKVESVSKFLDLLLSPRILRGSIPADSSTWTLWEHLEQIDGNHNNALCTL